MINNIPETKDHSRKFLSVLSRPMALSLQNRSFDDRAITWSGPYMDAQGEGPMFTLSMPILNTLINGSSQSFMGVAGIDIKMSEVQAFLGQDLVSLTSVSLSPSTVYTVFVCISVGSRCVHVRHRQQRFHVVSSAIQDSCKWIETSSLNYNEVLQYVPSC